MLITLPEPMTASKTEAYLTQQKYAEHERRELDRYLHRVLGEWAMALTAAKDTGDDLARLTRKLKDAYEDWLRRKARGSDCKEDEAS